MSKCNCESYEPLWQESYGDSAGNVWICHVCPRHGVQRVELQHCQWDWPEDDSMGMVPCPPTTHEKNLERWLEQEELLHQENMEALSQTGHDWTSDGGTVPPSDTEIPF